MSVHPATKNKHLHREAPEKSVQAWYKWVWPKWPWHYVSKTLPVEPAQREEYWAR